GNAPAGEGAEADERDAELAGPPTDLRIAQDLALPVALLRVARAVPERLVHAGRVAHQLGDAVADLPEDAFERLDVDARAVEFAEEAVRRPHAGVPERPPRPRVGGPRRKRALASDGRADRSA